MRNEAMLKDFYELATTDAVSGQESKIAAILTQKLEAMGFTVTQDDAGEKLGGDCGNVIGIREGELDGALLFSSHMDRMPNGFGIKPVEKDGVLYSDGTTILAADDLAGVCGILESFRQAIASGKPLPRLEVAFTVQEEPGVWGGNVLDCSVFKAKTGYVFDATGDIGRFVVEGPGRYTIDVELTGKPAHAGADPEKGIDAAKAMGEMLFTLKTGRLDFETVSNFPIVHGITARNSVCDSAGFKGEARSRNPEKLEKYMKYFDEHCRKIAAERGVGIEIVTELSYPTLNIAEGEPVLALAKKACEKLGFKYNPEAGGGGMDANHITAKGIRCIGCGCGYSKNHTKEEYLVLEEFFKLGQLGTTLIELYAEECKAK